MPQKMTGERVRMGQVADKLASQVSSTEEMSFLDKKILRPPSLLLCAIRPADAQHKNKSDWLV